METFQVLNSIFITNLQAGASQLSMAANVLLSPMAFQSGSPSSVQLVSHASGTNIGMSAIQV